MHYLPMIAFGLSVLGLVLLFVRPQAGQALVALAVIVLAIRALG